MSQIFQKDDNISIQIFRKEKLPFHMLIICEILTLNKTRGLKSFRCVT